MAGEGGEASCETRTVPAATCAKRETGAPASRRAGREGDVPAARHAKRETDAPASCRAKTARPAPISRRAFLRSCAAALPVLALGGVTATGLAACSAGPVPLRLINVSYDPTRELYEAYNQLFSQRWAEAHDGQATQVVQSHGGSGKQALEVANGLQADVVTLALAPDIDSLASDGLVSADWQTRLPNESAPYTSTIVLVVRAGNPLGIRDWGDLAREGVGVIAPNPKTSGGARWNYLAAWAWASRAYQDVSATLGFMRELYGNVLVLDSGARASTSTFVENGQGDVLVAWENEAQLVLRDYPGDYQVVTPSVSVRALPCVSVVDEVVDERGTREAADAYLDGLYSTEAQRICAENYYRPADETVRAEYADTFPDLELVGIEDFGGWSQAMRDHFADGTTFDEIYGDGR